ncbi:MAG: ABC transporter permease [Acidimicrobiales bacterium]
MGGRLRAIATTIGWGLVGVAAVVALWHVAATRVNELPSPADVFANMKEWLSDPFYDNGPNDQGVGRLVMGTLQRVAWGFGLAAVVGVPAGMLIGTSRRAWKAVNPVVQFLRPVSPPAWSRPTSARSLSTVSR